MDHHQSSQDLLGHFDRPKLLTSGEREWVAELHERPRAPEPKRVAGVEVAQANEPPVPSETFVDRPQPRVVRPTNPINVRGIGWVLSWAGAVGTLAMAVSVFANFFYLVAAEQSLNQAARAGAMEATLPRATYQSVTDAVERHLAEYPELTGKLQLRMLQNGQPIGGHFRPAEGDRLSITISAPSSTVIPSWLQKLTLWRSGTLLNARAERQAPGHKLPPQKT